MPDLDGDEFDDITGEPLTERARQQLAEERGETPVSRNSTTTRPTTRFARGGVGDYRDIEIAPPTSTTSGGVAAPWEYFRQEDGTLPTVYNVSESGEAKHVSVDKLYSEYMRWAAGDVWTFRSAIDQLKRAGFIDGKVGNGWTKKTADGLREALESYLELRLFANGAPETPEPPPPGSWADREGPAQDTPTDMPGLPLSFNEFLEQQAQANEESGFLGDGATAATRLSDPSMVAYAANRAARQALGRSFRPDELSKFVAAFHGREADATSEFDTPDPTVAAYDFIKENSQTEYQQMRGQGYVNSLLDLLKQGPGATPEFSGEGV